MDTDELMHAAVRPRGQRHVTDGLAAVRGAELQALAVAEERGVVEELGDHLLHVAAVLEHLRPRARQRCEQPVCMVEPSSLHHTRALRFNCAGYSHTTTHHTVEWNEIENSAFEQCAFFRIYVQL